MIPEIRHLLEPIYSGALKDHITLLLPPEPATPLLLIACLYLCYLN